MEPSAFDQQILGLRSDMRRYARHIIGETDEIEDLCQEAIIRAWVNRRKVRDLKGYLLFVLRGLCLNYRTRRRPLLVPPSELLQIVAVQNREPWEQVACRLAFHAAVRRLMQECRLTVSQRRRFWWVHYEGLTCAEVAARDHVTAGAAWQSVHSARLALRRGGVGAETA